MQSSTNLEPLEMDIITFEELIKHLTGERIDKVYENFNLKGAVENVESDVE